MSKLCDVRYCSELCLANPVEHILKTALGDAPVGYAESCLVSLHLVEEVLCTETLQWNLTLVTLLNSTW